ncbi:MAG: glycosyltransferase family 2 protein [Thermodesulfobacteriota bacterium]
MSRDPLASIVITSYNYGRYLRECIDSALSQTYPNTEVIVVDDGSTDDSPNVILSYGDRITAVLKENGGQASALNTGFSFSHGEVICFLDSDDALLPTAIQSAMPLFHEPSVVKVHWPMWAFDGKGWINRNKLIPSQFLPEGDLKEVILALGPQAYATPPTSGNAYAKGFLERSMPIPVEEFRLGGGDLYLATLAPMFGEVRRLLEPEGLYRIHDEKYTWQQPFRERVRFFIKIWDKSLEALWKRCRAEGIELDREALKGRSWWRQMDRAASELEALIPSGCTYVMVDDDLWGPGEVVPGARRLPFLERNGIYWGPAGDDSIAIKELERLRTSGACFISFVWSSFWWLSFYKGLNRHLRSRYRAILENERLVVFDLRDGRPMAPGPGVPRNGG